MLLFDKININYNQYFDMNNIIEITNYILLNNDSEYTNIQLEKGSIKIKIKLKEKKDIIFKTNLISNKKLYDTITVEIIKDKKGIPINFINEDNKIYHDVNELNIKFRKMNEDLSKEYFIINIIPVKDEQLFNRYKNNKKQRENFSN